MTDTEKLHVLMRQQELQRTTILLRDACDSYLSAKAQSEIAQIQARGASMLLEADASGKAKGPDGRTENMMAAQQLIAMAKGSMSNMLMVAEQLIALHRNAPDAPLKTPALAT